MVRECSDYEGLQRGPRCMTPAADAPASAPAAVSQLSQEHFAALYFRIRLPLETIARA